MSENSDRLKEIVLLSLPIDYEFQIRLFGNKIGMDQFADGVILSVKELYKSRGIEKKPLTAWDIFWMMSDIVTLMQKRNYTVEQVDSAKTLIPYFITALFANSPYAKEVADIYLNMSTKHTMDKYK